MTVLDSNITCQDPGCSRAEPFPDGADASRQRAMPPTNPLRIVTGHGFSHGSQTLSRAFHDIRTRSLQPPRPFYPDARLPGICGTC